MRAIVMRRYGGPEVLEPADLPAPRLGPDSVLVRTRAAGVQPADTELRAGRLDAWFTVRFPAVPGWDLAGVVEAVGPAASGFRPGDEVFGHVRQDWVECGTYAELVAAPVRTLAHKPATLSWEQAAVLPMPGLTSLQGADALGVGAGETLVVLGAGGLAGELVVQLAVGRGVRVLAVAPRTAHGRLRALGAQPVAGGPDAAEQVRSLVPEGADAVYDLAGGVTVPAFRRIASRPCWFASAADSDAVPQGGRFVLAQPDTEDLATLADLVDTGRLTVPPATSFPLGDAGEAHALSGTGTAEAIALTLA